LGFIYLFIIPGYLILDILNIHEVEYTVKIILFIGLSISFTIFYGLIINILLPFLGYRLPISTMPLLILFDIALLILTYIIRSRKMDEEIFYPNFILSIREKIFLIPPILFIAMSFYGVYIMNTQNNNFYLLFLLFTIPVYIIICLYKYLLPKRLCPIIIYLVSLSITIIGALRSAHVIGIDAQTEYYLFQMTLQNHMWGILLHSPLDACLSISLLPAIYQLFISVNPEVFFNIFYILLFSICPVIVYIIAKKYIGYYYAFIASIFYMFQSNYIFSIGEARTHVAILFFAMAIMTLFNDDIPRLAKTLLFLVFLASCIASHYSTSYIFFIIYLGILFGVNVLQGKWPKKTSIISITSLAIFFVLIFYWYSQITDSAFSAGVVFIDRSLNNMIMFFNLKSRNDQAQALLGQNILIKNIPQKIEFLFTWLILITLVLGVIIMIRKYKEMVLSGNKDFVKPDYLNNKFESEYYFLAIVCSILLMLMLTLPFVTVAYSIDRLYCMVTTVMAVFFIIGAIGIARIFTLLWNYIVKHLLKTGIMRKHYIIEPYIIILFMLIPYFFCITGITYYIFGYQRQIILNRDTSISDINQKNSFIHDEDSYAAFWLSKNRDPKININADEYRQLALESQGKISSLEITQIYGSNKINGYIFLGYINNLENKVFIPIGKVYSMTNIKDVLKKACIYDGGLAKLYL
jgi:uncharacterized membrane protein